MGIVTLHDDRRGTGAQWDTILAVFRIVAVFPIIPVRLCQFRSVHGYLWKARRSTVVMRLLSCSEIPYTFRAFERRPAFELDAQVWYMYLLDSTPSTRPQVIRICRLCVLTAINNRGSLSEG